MNAFLLHVLGRWCTPVRGWWWGGLCWWVTWTLIPLLLESLTRPYDESRMAWVTSSPLLSTSPKKSAFQARGCRLIVNWKKIGKDRDRSSAGWGLQASVAPGTGTRCCSRNNSCRRGFGRQCRGSISTYRACRRGGVSWRTVVVMAAYRPRDARRKDWSTKHWLGYSYLKSNNEVLNTNILAYSNIKKMRCIKKLLFILVI